MLKEKAMIFLRRFVRRYAVLLVALAVLFGEGVLVRVIAYHNAYRDAGAVYAAQYDDFKADFVAEWEREHAETEDELLQAQIDADTYILERVGMGVLSVYEKADLDDAGTQMQTCINRVLSGGEFQKVQSIQDAVAIAGTWIGLDMGASVTEDVHQLAAQMVTALHKGEPMPVSAKYLWTEWDYSEGELVARDKYMIDSSCHYWRYSQR